MPSDPLIIEAIQNVRELYSLDEWAALPQQQMTSMIYQEIRRLDSLRVAATLLDLQAVVKAA